MTAEKIAVLQAYKEGKPIQQQYRTDVEWKDVENPSWDFSKYYYRVKPEPEYRPYRNAGELEDAIRKHGVWLISKECDLHFHTLMYKYNDKSVWVNGVGKFTYDAMLNIYTWQDGTPFGKLEEE